MIMSRVFCHDPNLKNKLTMPFVQSLLQACNKLEDEESKQLAEDTYESIKSMCVEPGKGVLPTPSMTY